MIKEVFIYLVILGAFISCGSNTNDNNGTADNRSWNLLRVEDKMEILALNGARPLDVAFKIEELSKNFKDYNQFLRSLDNSFKISCSKTCLIKRKTK